MSLIKLANTPKQWELGNEIVKKDRELANHYMEFSDGVGEVIHARKKALERGIPYKPGTTRFHYDFNGKEYAKFHLPFLK